MLINESHTLGKNKSRGKIVRSGRNFHSTQKVLSLPRKSALLHFVTREMKVRKFRKILMVLVIAEAGENLPRDLKQFCQ